MTPLDIGRMVTLKVAAGFHQKTLFAWGLHRENPLLAALLLNKQHFASFHVDFCHHRAHFDEDDIPRDSSHTHK